MTLKPTYLVLAASLALGACAGTPDRIDSLEQARADYARAANDPAVARHAPKELDAAKVALEKAERLYEEDEDRADIDFQADLAAKRVRTAEMIANGREADRRIDDAKLERQRAQLEMRESELNRSKAEIEQARREAEELKRQMAELQARETERGMVLTLGDVLFEVNEAELAPGATRNIDKIAAFLNKYPERTAIVEGHTDSMGDANYNLDLSRERAWSVRQALVARGVDGSRISTQGYGMTLPVASNSSSAGRAQNRRVEVIFPDAPGQVSESAY